MQVLLRNVQLIRMSVSSQLTNAPPANLRVSRVSSISSSDDSPIARTVMSLLSQKVMATSEVARKRKIS